MLPFDGLVVWPLKSLINPIFPLSCLGCWPLILFSLVFSRRRCWPMCSCPSWSSPGLLAGPCQATPAHPSPQPRVDGCRPLDRHSILFITATVGSHHCLPLNCCAVLSERGCWPFDLAQHFRPFEPNSSKSLLPWIKMLWLVALCCCHPIDTSDPTTSIPSCG